MCTREISTGRMRVSSVYIILWFGGGATGVSDFVTSLAYGSDVLQRRQSEDCDKSTVQDCSTLFYTQWFALVQVYIWRNSFSPYEDLKILDVLFTSHSTPHITLGNEQCLKLLLGVCSPKKRGDLLYLCEKSRWACTSLLYYIIFFDVSQATTGNWAMTTNTP